MEKIGMEKRKKLEGLHVTIDREIVFRQLECYPDSPVYEEMEEAYEELLQEANALCHPEGLVALGKIPSQYDPEKKGIERECIYVLVTIGQELSACSTAFFAEGDYVKGMMADAMADAALFSLEETVQKNLRDVCARWKRGVKRRLEAPQDISMEIQKEALIQTGAGEELGVRLSEGYMFRPLKTSSQIYLTTDDETIFKAQHNCRTCPNVKCGLRHVEPLTIQVMQEEGGMKKISLLTGTLLDTLRNQMSGIQAPCGGRGSCGKCRVQVLEGELPVTAEDEKIFSMEELREGWRLACQAYPQEDLTVRIGWSSEAEMEVQTGFFQEKGETKQPDEKKEEKNGSYGIAIDIGTTTLAIQLLSLKDAKVIDTYTHLNSQRGYGADVIARIQSAVGGKQDILRKRVVEDLWQGIERLQKKYQLNAKDIRQMAIGGNTTMIHLLMGYPCEGLGHVPFTPYKIEKIEIDGKILFPEMESGVSIQIYPGISAFVGADIVAGLCALGMGKGEKLRMLIDLGTNGEMALGNEEKLLVTSTAAGPAFEGGNITWGTGSIPGAICNAWMKEGKLEIQTIQDQPPVGICGTGVIELTAELVKNEIIDETGRLEEAWFAEGYPVTVNTQGETIRLTQKDIREIQLAKAAIRGGIETLLVRYGIGADQVEQIYVAGGFGYWLDYEKAIGIGMFPEEFSGKIQAVGNSSLGGAGKLLMDQGLLKEAEEIVGKAIEIDLSTDQVFQEHYMEAMFFE